MNYPVISSPMIGPIISSQWHPWEADLRKGPMEAANDFELSHRQVKFWGKKPLGGTSLWTTSRHEGEPKQWTWKQGNAYILSVDILLHFHVSPMSPKCRQLNSIFNSIFSVVSCRPRVSHSSTGHLKGRLWANGLVCQALWWPLSDAEWMVPFLESLQRGYNGKATKTKQQKLHSS